MKNPLDGPHRLKRSNTRTWLENYDQRHRRPHPGRPGSLDDPTVRALRLARQDGPHGAVKHLARCWGIHYDTAKDAARGRTYKQVPVQGPVREPTPEEHLAAHARGLEDGRNP